MISLYISFEFFITVISWNVSFYKTNFLLNSIDLYSSFAFFGGHESFLWGHWYPCFGLLVISAPYFKTRVDPSLTCFVACVQWIPRIYLWCDTCWPLGSQHGSQDFWSIYLQIMCPQAFWRFEPTTYWACHSTALLTIRPLRLGLSSHSVSWIATSRHLRKTVLQICVNYDKLIAIRKQ